MTAARRALLATGKWLLAAALLAGVLSQVHWHDYAVERATGRTVAVLERRNADGECRARVASGRLWWRAERFLDCAELAPPLPGGPIVAPGLATSLDSLHGGLAALALAVYMVVTALLAARWWLLLRAAGATLSLWEATRFTFVGLFLNTFMPGSVGGDLVKAYLAARISANRAGAVLSILVDRLIGVLGFALVAVAAATTAALLGALEGEASRRAIFSSLALLAGLASILAVLLSERLRRVFALGRIATRLGFERHLDDLGRAARSYRSRLGAIASAACVTLLATILMFWSFAILGKALDLPAAWHAYFVYAPLVTVLITVPLTPGAVGVAEVLYLLYFGPMGCGASQVLAFTLLLRLLGVAGSLPGGLWLLRGSRAPTAAEVASEIGGGPRPS
jgi:uncharacterized protein (TIRG00374 family)